MLVSAREDVGGGLGVLPARPERCIDISLECIVQGIGGQQLTLRATQERERSARRALIADRPPRRRARPSTS